MQLPAWICVGAGKEFNFKWKFIFRLAKCIAQDFQRWLVNLAAPILGFPIYYTIKRPADFPHFSENQAHSRPLKLGFQSHLSFLKILASVCYFTTYLRMGELILPNIKTKIAHSRCRKELCKTGIIVFPHFMGGGGFSLMFAKHFQMFGWKLYIFMYGPVLYDLLDADTDEAFTIDLGIYVPLLSVILCFIYYSSLHCLR